MFLFLGFSFSLWDNVHHFSLFSVYKRFLIFFCAFQSMSISRFCLFTTFVQFCSRFSACQSAELINTRIEYSSISSQFFEYVLRFKKKHNGCIRHPTSQLINIRQPKPNQMIVFGLVENICKQLLGGL